MAFMEVLVKEGITVRMFVVGWWGGGWGCDVGWWGVGGGGVMLGGGVVVVGVDVAKKDK